MKHLFLLILSPFLICTAMAQNGGQSPENNYAKLVYLGYTNGKYQIQLTNKQSCGVDFNITWLGKDTSIYVQGTVTIELPGAPRGMEKIRAKPLYRCGSSGGDMGFVEVITPVALPLKFTRLSVAQISKTELRVNFEIAEATNVKQFNIQLSKNWGERKPVMVLFPDEIQPNRNYSVKIPLSPIKK